jgi:LmbE family N-acetylglucosaminyl deacetylase
VSKGSNHAIYRRNVMHPAPFNSGALTGGTLLCVGAHSDDLEIGCAGTVRKLVRMNPGLRVDWVVCTASGVREQEARESAKELLARARSANVVLKSFRNGYFHSAVAEIKEFFESLKSLPAPDVILTHYRHDLHQDHRTVAELTWNTFRDHTILEYEVPKFDGDLGAPNVFMTLSAEEVGAKVALLQGHFHSQRDKQWFSGSTFEGLCRIRGIECNSPTGFAEAFYGRKLVIG